MCGRILCDCTYKGKNLWGKVQIVTNRFADFKVQIVTNGLEDLKVKTVPVPGLTTGCGQWQFVTNGLYDFSIQYVTNGLYDFTIQNDNNFAGIP